MRRAKLKQARLDYSREFSVPIINKARNNRPVASFENGTRYLIIALEDGSEICCGFTLFEAISSISEARLYISIK